MTATWRSRLKHASFRGVLFFFTSVAIDRGQRLNVFNPLNDEASIQALGKKVQNIRIEGYHIGDDPHLDSEKLAALADGIRGELVHPYLGSINCYLREYLATDRQREGGYITFTANFVTGKPAALERFQATAAAPATAQSSVNNAVALIRNSVLDEARNIVGRRLLENTPVSRRAREIVGNADTLFLGGSLAAIIGQLFDSNIISTIGKWLAEIAMLDGLAAAERGTLIAEVANIRKLAVVGAGARQLVNDEALGEAARPQRLEIARAIEKINRASEVPLDAFYSLETINSGVSAYLDAITPRFVAPAALSERTNALRLANRRGIPVGDVLASLANVTHPAIL